MEMRLTDEQQRPIPLLFEVSAGQKKVRSQMWKMMGEMRGGVVSKFGAGRSTWHEMEGRGGGVCGSCVRPMRALRAWSVTA